MLDAGRMGLADLVFIVSFYYPAQLPLSYYAYLVPFSVTLEESVGLLDEARPFFEQEFAANNLKYMESCPNSQEWFFNRSINLDTPDWKGLKVRARAD